MRPDKLLDSKRIALVGHLCSWIGVICSILAITSCSFVSVTWSESDNDIPKIGPFRYYDAATESCTSYWNDNGADQISGKSVYRWTTLDGIYMLFSTTLATIGVACGVVAALLLFSQYLFSISRIRQYTPLSDDTDEKMRKGILGLFVGSCIFQSATVVVFLYNPRYSTCAIGSGAILSFVSVVLYGIAILTQLHSASGNDEPRSNYYAFDVDSVEYDQLGRPLVDPQSNYGQLPPWVHTIQ